LALLVVSYPTLAPPDVAWITQIRRQYSTLTYSTLAPHFTLVFPTVAVAQDSLAAHVQQQVAGWDPISFVLRSCIPFKDPSSPYTYVFLVPGEGFSRIIKLHDTLYTGPLAPELRLDIPFIPHVTIGYSLEPQVCKELADGLNQQEFVLRGNLDRLDIVSKEDNAMRTVIQLPLATP
jgi:2'-5' RNA ligase